MNFQAAQFDYNPITHTYVAEASTLGISAPGNYISINGHVFMFTHADKDASGDDTMGWRFNPTIGAVSLNPALAGHRVLIIND